MILDIEALEAKDRVNLMAKENRLRAAVKGDEFAKTKLAELGRAEVDE